MSRTGAAVPSLGDITRPARWDRAFSEGRCVMQRLVDLEMPTLAAANGRASTGPLSHPAEYETDTGRARQGTLYPGRRRWHLT